MPQVNRSAAELDRELDGLLRMCSVPPGTPLAPDGSAGSFLPHVYVLGCLDRRVTIFAQQTRALNLVWALHTRGFGSNGIRGKRIGIVGAGIAGLTASIAALRLSASVVVLDRNEIAIQDQNACMSRWLHPRIFDWPYPGWRNSNTGLPVLDWNADYAGKVSVGLKSKWENEFQAKGGRSFMGVENVHFVSSPPGSSQHLLCWTQNGVGKRDSFDAVLLAIGFGKEQEIEGAPSPRYWLDTGVQPNARHILVIGCGDGGLIEVLRARLQHFTQDGLVRSLLSFDGHEQLEKEVAELEHEFAHNRLGRKDLALRYSALSYVGRLESRLESMLHPKREVTLVGPDSDHLNPAASPLHRLLVHLLVTKPNQFHVHFKSARVERILSENGNHRVVCSTDGPQSHDWESKIFNQVLVRIGPASALQSGFPTVHKAVSRQFPLVQPATLPEQLWPEGAFSDGPVSPAVQRSSSIEVVPLLQVPWLKYLEGAQHGSIYSPTGSWFLEQLGTTHEVVQRFLARPDTRLDLYVSDPSGVNFEPGFSDTMEERRRKIDKVRERIGSLPRGPERIALRFVDARIRYSLHVFDNQVVFIPQPSNDIFRHASNSTLPALCFNRTDGGSGQRFWELFLESETASHQSVAQRELKFSNERTFLGRYKPDAAQAVNELTEDIRQATRLLHCTITSPNIYSRHQPRSEFNDALIQRARQGLLRVRALVARGNDTRLDRVRRLLQECSADNCHVRVLPDSSPPLPQLINFAVIDDKKVVQIVHREGSGYFLTFDEPEVIRVFTEHFEKLYESGVALTRDDLPRLHDLLGAAFRPAQR
ncbi:hypothetical protein [Archangium sp.]|uniref:hypothetical protein n=1 Tax=Archangium sp. TaxID=1872627 RepID=UPI002D2281D2|nr:hypothetical protein [Archangium sp.]HYO60151.1 hypothetical protein [Archangium sp.]